MTCVTGVSGSGKSTLVNDTLYKSVADLLNKSNRNPAPHKEIRRPRARSIVSSTFRSRQSGVRHVPTPPPTAVCSHRFASCLPAPRRPVHAAICPAASVSMSKAADARRARVMVSSRSRCTSCPMSMFPATCAAVKRYNRETLEIRYKGKNIYEVLEMTVEDALEFSRTCRLSRRNCRH